MKTDDEIHAGPRASWEDVARVRQEVIERLNAELAAARALAWIPGAPPKPYRSEWFIAETIHGDRVVLTALPEEYTYDYKTADDTYLMARNIKRWMQFPDSEFKSAAEAEAARLRVALQSIAGKVIYTSTAAVAMARTAQAALAQKGGR